MGRRIIYIIGVGALLAGLLLSMAACENPLLGTVQQIYTTFHSNLVQANFSSNNATQYFDPGIGNITVNFTDQSIGNISTYDWDFGDGGSSTLPNPSHTYYAEGYYTVSLTVDGPDGDSTEIKEDFVAAYSATPLVNIFYPDDDDWVTGTVSVQANADFPPEPIINVQFFVDGSLAYTDTTAPYAYSWDTGGELQNVLIPLKAVANTGSVAGTDDDTAVRVDRTDPVTTLTAPSGGAVSGSVSMTATLSDTYSGPDRVEFYVDGSRRYTDYTSAYSYTWNARFYTEGTSHTLLARGFDEVGLYSNDSTSVTIDNLGDFSPVVLDALRIDGINNRVSVDASPDPGFDAVVVAYEDAEKGQILLKVSTNGGADFVDHLVIEDTKFIPSNPVVAFEPNNRDIYLAYLHDVDGDGRKDVVLLRSEDGGDSWEPVLFNSDEPFIDGPNPTGLALDVQATHIALLFDAGRDLYIAYSADLGPHTTYTRLVDSAYARDMSVAAYGGLAYASYVNRDNDLMFIVWNMNKDEVASDLQKLATDVQGYSSTALDPSGKMVGVAFSNRYANPMALLADSGELKFNPVEEFTDTRDCTYTSLTLGNESIRLAYASVKSGLRLAASQTGKYWINYMVDEKYTFAYVSMAADGDGRQHVGYYDADNLRLKFASVPFNW